MDKTPPSGPSPSSEEELSSPRLGSDNGDVRHLAQHLTVLCFALAADGECRVERVATLPGAPLRIRVSVRHREPIGNARAVAFLQQWTAASTGLWQRTLMETSWLLRVTVVGTDGPLSTWVPAVQQGGRQSRSWVQQAADPAWTPGDGSWRLECLWRPKTPLEPALAYLARVWNQFVPASNALRLKVRGETMYLPQPLAAMTPVSTVLGDDGVPVAWLERTAAVASDRAGSERPVFLCWQGAIVSQIAVRAATDGAADATGGSIPRHVWVAHLGGALNWPDLCREDLAPLLRLVVRYVMAAPEDACASEPKAVCWRRAAADDALLTCPGRRRLASYTGKAAAAWERVQVGRTVAPADLGSALETLASGSAVHHHVRRATPAVGPAWGLLALDASRVAGLAWALAMAAWVRLRIPGPQLAWKGSLEVGYDTTPSAQVSVVRTNERTVVLVPGDKLPDARWGPRCASFIAAVASAALGSAFCSKALAIMPVADMAQAQAFCELHVTDLLTAPEASSDWITGPWPKDDAVVQHCVASECSPVRQRTAVRAAGGGKRGSSTASEALARTGKDVHADLLAAPQRVPVSKRPRQEEDAP